MPDGLETLLRAEALLRDARTLVAEVGGTEYGDTPLGAPVEAFVATWDTAIGALADLVGRTGRWSPDAPS